MPMEERVKDPLTAPVPKPLTDILIPLRARGAA
jgi:hypothetical protein